MTNEEFKLEFNTYYNNITSNQAPGVNDYEISQFLTLAEEQIVAEIYDNKYSGFEKTERLRKSIDALLRERIVTIEKTQDNIFDTNAYNGDISPLANNESSEPSEEINYPDEVLFVVMEWAKIGTDSHPRLSPNGVPVLDLHGNQVLVYSKTKTVEVIPIKYDDFLRTYKNPFRGASSKRVLRVDTDDNKVVLHAAKDWEIIEYHIEFVKKPLPIIIGNDDFAGLTINGLDAGIDVPCELDSSIHRAILLRAVQIAKASWQSK